MQLHSTISRIISYYAKNVNILIKIALFELLSLFIHHLYKPPYRLFVPFRLRLHCESFILLCGASVTAWCFALCSHSASHRGAICTHSLTNKLVDSLRLIIYWRGTLLVNILTRGTCFP